MSDDANRCPHDDDPRCCPPCQGAAPTVDAAEVVLHGPWPARFPGRCLGCSYGIHEGQIVVRVLVDGDTAGFAHSGACADDVAASQGVISR